MATKADKAALHMVRQSFIGTLDGDEVEYHEGEVVEADDPAVKKWPAMFGPLVIKANRKRASVEQATAEPGEKRDV